MIGLHRVRLLALMASLGCPLPEPRPIPPRPTILRPGAHGPQTADDLHQWSLRGCPEGWRFPALERRICRVCAQAWVAEELVDTRRVLAELIDVPAPQVLDAVRRLVGDQLLREVEVDVPPQGGAA